MRHFTENELGLITKALIEYEEKHYTNEDTKYKVVDETREKLVGELISEFKKAWCEPEASKEPKTLGKYFVNTFDGTNTITSQVHTDLKIAEYTILDSVNADGADITDEEWDILKKAMDVMRKMDKQIGGK